MSDVLCWVKEEFGGPIISLDELSNYGFDDGIRRIIADELKLESPNKVDLLGVSPLRQSHSKLVVVHVYGYQADFAHTTPVAIADKVKKVLDLPADHQCVSVNFIEVFAWGKA
ncbi:MAG TPA: hypothetical protein VLF21_02420 [Candidatus Saccharimonadales bacterium]|nr:hypothetical protein [Candidatus Saccharimonadales bacterium]